MSHWTVWDITKLLVGFQIFCVKKGLLYIHKIIYIQNYSTSLWLKIICFNNSVFRILGPRNPVFFIVYFVFWLNAVSRYCTPISRYCTPIFEESKQIIVHDVCVVFINIWRNYVNREQGHIKLKKLLLLLWKKVDDESHFS